MHSIGVLESIFDCENMKDIFWVEESNGEPLVCRKRRRRVGKRKIEFVGWGSKPLIEFLEAIGQDTTKKHSRQDVAAFITKYIKDNRLTSAEKKRKVLCDERLRDLFGKKSMSRIKVFEMLEEHFAENHNDSDSEPLDTSEEEGYREKGSLGLRNNATVQMKKVLKAPRNGFAAIVPENIKLIYIKKSLIQELLAVPDSFEDKMMGSFVRLKSDPNDIYQKNCFQLQLVTGVEKVPGTGDATSEIQLRLSNYFKDIPICELSDDNFSEEEIVDLRDRIKAGLLKRLTVSELELKAKMMHADITKHWIAKELSLLKNLIDRANEKGWRRELFDHLERRKMLQTPSEIEKLLYKIPEVIAEEVEPEDTEATPTAFEKAGNGYPPSIVRGSSDVSSTGSGDVVAPSQLGSYAPKVQNGDVNGFVPINEYNEYQQAFETPKKAKETRGDSCADSIRSETMMISNGSSRPVPALCSVQTKPQEKPQHTVDNHHSPNPVINLSKQLMSSGDAQGKPEQTVGGSHIPNPVVELSVIELSDDDEEGPKGNYNSTGEVIRLNDDDEEGPKGNYHSTGENPNDSVWHYKDPQGQTQGPFSLNMLKRWSDANYFPPGFAVWRSRHTSSDAILLADLLGRTCPPH